MARTPCLLLLLLPPALCQRRTLFRHVDVRIVAWGQASVGGARNDKTLRETRFHFCPPRFPAPHPPPNLPSFAREPEMSARRFASTNTSARGGRVPARLTSAATCVKPGDTCTDFTGGLCSLGAMYTKDSAGTVAKTYFGSVPPAGVAFQIVQATNGRPDLACESQAKAALAAGATSAYCFAQTDARTFRTAVLGGTCTASGTAVCETPRARTNAEAQTCDAVVEFHASFAEVLAEAAQAADAAEALAPDIAPAGQTQTS